MQAKTKPMRLGLFAIALVAAYLAVVRIAYALFPSHFLVIWPVALFVFLGLTIAARRRIDRPSA
jgi:hypothetical protein